MGLADNIKNYRLKKKLTLEEVAQKVGITRSTLSKYESGSITNIPSDKIEKIASALETTPGELMDWEDDYDEETRMIARKYYDFDTKDREKFKKLLDIIDVDHDD